VKTFLDEYKVEIQSLEGYEGLSQYVRYRIQSPYTNDNLLRVCSRMPEDHYRIVKADRRRIELRRGEETATPKPDGMAEWVVKREKTGEKVPG